MTRRLATAALFCLSVAFGVAFVELGLRIYFLGSLRQPDVTDPLVVWQPHKTRGWTLAPNVFAKFQTVDYVTTFRTNSRGLADSEHDYEPARGTARIVILGDSFMQAAQVPFDAAFARRLASRLAPAPVEVINLGVAGYGTYQEYLYLMEEGFKYKPDIVLLAFYALNDVHNNSNALSTLVWGPENIQTFGRAYPPVPGSAAVASPDLKKLGEFHRDRLRRQAAHQSLYDQSMIAQILTLNQERRATDIWTPTEDLNIYIGPILKKYSASFTRANTVPVSQYNTLWSQAWEATFSSLQQIETACEQIHAALVVFDVPDKMQVEPEYRDLCARRWPGLEFDVEAPNRKLAEFCAARGIQHVDVLPAFIDGQSKGAGPYFHVLRDRHWNPAGHDLAAERVAAYLVDSGLLNRAVNRD